MICLVLCVAQHYAKCLRGAQLVFELVAAKCGMQPHQDIYLEVHSPQVNSLHVQFILSFLFNFFFAFLAMMVFIILSLENRYLVPTLPQVYIHVTMHCFIALQNTLRPVIHFGCGKRCILNSQFKKKGVRKKVLITQFYFDH